jgi:hypothetical protein
MKKLFIILSLCFVTLNSMAQTEGFRFKALSMLETGDRDYRRGRSGEISRFQILPSLWARYCSDRRSKAWENPWIARGVAVKIMQDRVRAFKATYHHEPTLAEWALLWHCPARVEHPTSSDLDYIRRFSNLVEKFQQGK